MPSRPAYFRRGRRQLAMRRVRSRSVAVAGSGTVPAIAMTWAGTDFQSEKSNAANES
jgi:hypothetical protein